MISIYIAEYKRGFHGSRLAFLLHSNLIAKLLIHHHDDID